jgi:hypothetical protein
MSATRVRRTFAATPVRSASLTWAAIVDMVAPDGSTGRSTLTAAGGVAASLIAAEAWRAMPLIVSGTGPQLRVYCLYGEDAILGEDTNEDALSWSPTDGEWRMEVPCPPADLDWVTSAFRDVSRRIAVVDNSIRRESAVVESAALAAPAIDMEAFLRG